jgi:5-methylcytosine-specific restriction protein A
MAFTDVTTSAVLSAIAEFDRLGREAFLKENDFKQSRRYWIRHGGKLYDSKAIVGVAHGYLPGQRRLKASEFSGGIGHAVTVLRRLGFEVTDQPDVDLIDESSARLTPDEIVSAVSGLKPALVAGKPMLKQAVVLLWAIGRVRAGKSRLLRWADTVAMLTPLLEEHRREGERRQGRPDYPIAALFHAGLWDLPGHTDDVPPAHGDSALKAWFTEHSPEGGLPWSVYALVRRSGQARIRIVEAVTARFFDDFDDSGLLTAVGLYNDQVAADEASPSRGADHQGAPGDVVEDPKADYARWCELVARREAGTYGRRRITVSNDPIRLGAARRAVLLRSEGRCENPGCVRPAPDLTDRGEPVLEVDHVEQIADGGRDHPVQMIALCPDCHAVKTRGRSRHQLISALAHAAHERHDQWIIATG